MIDVENGGITFAEWMTRDANCYSANSNPVVFPKYGTAKFNFRQNEDIRDVDVECVQTRKEQYKNSESRNPETIFGTIEDDAKRRDLTINALYLNLSTLEVIDPTNSGLKDIKECVIRTTNTPSIIFNEDPLRLLRVIRFATRLGWGIEKDTWFGIIENADRIDIVSKERVAEELSNILMCSKPSIGFNRLKSCGLLKILLPEVYEMIGLKQGVQHFGDVFEHTMSVIDKTGDNKLAKWAALLHDTGKVESLSYTNETPHFYGHEYISGGITKTVLSLGILCLALVLGMSFVSTTRAQKHYHRLMYAAHNNLPEQVIAEYHHLPKKLRLIVQSHYDEARKVIEDSARLSDLFPTMEAADALGKKIMQVVYDMQ